VIVNVSPPYSGTGLIVVGAHLGQTRPHVTRRQSHHPLLHPSTHRYGVHPAFGAASGGGCTYIDVLYIQFHVSDRCQNAKSEARNGMIQHIQPDA